ncbi:aminotransferase class I/II-fold pyridoxal phosphate-dependent enzyme [Klebsiella variicola subsp. variicola]|nr:aminotransferase class I/II-fold pyridoxal phosphate-dependent enzyme [Klebsiella variicola subsp. variicola]
MLCLILLLRRWWTRWKRICSACWKNWPRRVNTEALPLIDLSSGSPDQPTPPEVIDSLQSAIHRRENHGYPSFWGKPQVREAIAQFYRRQYDVELDPHSRSRRVSGFAYRHWRHPAGAAQPRSISDLHRSLLSDLPLGGAQSQAAFYGACRSGRRTISCRILTTSPGGG